MKGALPRAIALTVVWLAFFGLRGPLSDFIVLALVWSGAVLAFYARWYEYRPPPVFAWVRLVAGFLLVGLNLSAYVVVFRGSRYDFGPHVLLPAAVLADTIVAGVILGAAASEVIAFWYRRRHVVRLRRAALSRLFSSRRS